MIIPTADGERASSIVSFSPKPARARIARDAAPPPALHASLSASLLPPIRHQPLLHLRVDKALNRPDGERARVVQPPHWTCRTLSKNTREVLLACPSLRRAISPVDTAAELVRSLVKQAEATLDRKVTSAGVTVPADFDDTQRCATETACLQAALEKVRL